MFNSWVYIEVGNHVFVMPLWLALLLIVIEIFIAIGLLLFLTA